MRFFLLGTLLLSVCGCSSLSAITVTDQRTGVTYTVPERLQHISGMKELAQACVTDAGRVVHRAVKVDGYLNPGMSRCNEACWRIAMHMPFAYNEFEVNEVKLGDYLQQTGYWRISKQELGDPNCQPQPSEYVRNIAESRGWKTNFCLAMERVERLSSDYTLRNDYQRSYIEIGEGARLSRSRLNVIEISSGSELGFDVSYTLFAGTEFLHSKRTWGCTSIGISPPGRASGRWLEYDVLKPK